MRVAVLTLTRDRLPFTQHCFQTLRDNAGVEFDWYILDQGSTDGTVDWLLGQDDLDVTELGENVGISAGLNILLDEAVNAELYDVIVKVDNDCEVVTSDTLRAVCEKTLEYGAALSPRIHGLRQPPQTIRTIDGIDETPVIGGIFLAAPAKVFADGYRHDEKNNPLWAGDDYNLCNWMRRRGRLVGYLQGYDANHYLTTEGQETNDPAYLERKTREMAA